MAWVSCAFRVWKVFIMNRMACFISKSEWSDSLPSSSSSSSSCSSGCRSRCWPPWLTQLRVTSLVLPSQSSFFLTPMDHLGFHESPRLLTSSIHLEKSSLGEDLDDTSLQNSASSWSLPWADIMCTVATVGLCASLDWPNLQIPPNVRNCPSWSLRKA